MRTQFWFSGLRLDHRRGVAYREPRLSHRRVVAYGGPFVHQSGLAYGEPRLAYQLSRVQWGSGWLRRHGLLHRGVYRSSLLVGEGVTERRRTGQNHHRWKGDSPSLG